MCESLAGNLHAIRKALGKYATIPLKKMSLQVSLARRHQPSHQCWKSYAAVKRMIYIQHLQTWDWSGSASLVGMRFVRGCERPN